MFSTSGEIKVTSSNVFIFASITYSTVSICDALRELVPFVQSKKREKDPWRSYFILQLLAKLQNKTLQLY